MPLRYAPLRGAHFRPPAQEALAILPAYTKLELRREPDNEHDSNAIAVFLPALWFEDEVNRNRLIEATSAPLSAPLMLGYVAKEVALEWAKELDEDESEAVPTAQLLFSPEGKPLVAIGEEEE